MAKSRVEKNKSLYETLEKDEFDLVDITEEKKSVEKQEVQQPIVEVKKQEVIPVAKPKKNEVAVVKEKPKVKAKAEVIEEEFVTTQPVSYKDRLSIEEVLRVKLEKQQQLKNQKRLYKKTPVTETYTSEMMQKNINQKDGVDVRREVNIRVKQGNKFIGFLLVVLLLAVIAAGAAAIYFLW